MKILYIHDEYLSSFKANIIQVINMCIAFSENNINVTLALPHENRFNNDIISSIERTFNEKIEFNIITYKKLTFFGRLHFIGGCLSVWKILSEYGCDICYLRNAAYLSIALFKKIPSIYEAHQLVLHNGNVVFNIFWKTLLIRMAKNINLLKFIAISQALSDAWVEFGIPKKKSNCIA